MDNEYYHQLIINSKDRDSGSASDFTITMNDPVYIDKYRFRSCSIPLGRSIIHDNNKTFIFDQSGQGSNTITLTEAFYNGPQLATELTDKINDIDADFTVTYSSSTKKLTFENQSSGDGYILDFSGGNGNLFGFDSTETTARTDGTLVSSYPIDLGPNNVFYLRCPELQSSHTQINSAGDKQNYIKAIPNNSDNGDTLKIYYGDQEPWVYMGNKKINSINMTLLDEDGNEYVQGNPSFDSVIEIQYQPPKKKNQ